MMIAKLIFRLSVIACLLLVIGRTQIDKTDNSTNRHDDGFVEIFDGKTMNGWEGDSTYWKVQDGCLLGVITPETIVERNSFIIWLGDMPSDFELKVEYKVSENRNSGINYRSEKVEGVHYGLRGYQADLDGKNRFTGSNYEERGRTTLASQGEIVVLPVIEDLDSLQNFIKSNRWLPSIVKSSLGHLDSLKSKIKEDDWNECHLVVKGNRMRHYINGTLMSDVIDMDTVNRRSDGLMGVQVHVGPPMKIMYRNFRLRSL